MFDLTGMTALVTGASGGIGSAIAKALAACGARVALSGTRAEALAAVAFTPPGHPIGTQRKTTCPSLMVTLVAAMARRCHEAHSAST